MFINLANLQCHYPHLVIKKLYHHHCEHLKVLLESICYYSLRHHPHLRLKKKLRNLPIFYLGLAKFFWIFHLNYPLPNYLIQRTTNTIFSRAVLPLNQTIWNGSFVIQNSKKLYKFFIQFHTISILYLSSPTFSASKKEKNRKIARKKRKSGWSHINNKCLGWQHCSNVLTPFLKYFKVEICYKIKLWLNNLEIKSY